MAWVLPAVLGGASLLGGIFGNRPKTTTQTSTGTEDIDISELPLYDPKLAQFRDNLINMFLSRAENIPDFFERFTASGLSDINRSSDIVGRQAENLVTSRGLGRTSAGASSLVMPEINRLIEQNRFLSQVPLAREQLTSDIYGQAAGLLSSLPVGTRRSGQVNTTQNVTQKGSGNMLGGGFSSLATTLAGLYGAGAFGKKPSPGGNTLVPGGAWNNIFG